MGHQQLKNHKTTGNFDWRFYKNSHGKKLQLESIKCFQIAIFVFIVAWKVSIYDIICLESGICTIFSQRNSYKYRETTDKINDKIREIANNLFLKKNSKFVFFSYIICT